MADSKRQDIMDAIIARMQTVLTAGGYETNLGQHVGDWQVQWDTDEYPACGVCDMVAESQPAPGQSEIEFDDTQEIQVLPVVFRLFGRDAATLRKMIADVKKAIKVDPRWTVGGVGLAMGTRPKRAGLIVDPDSFEVAGAAVEVEVSFITGMFDAYA